ncbi:hypothetical protein [Nonomuraea africana]|uniref:Uncharacterized protein n=1 Tax=Nonomuraea africana TaxID=46171 RepID=A0ABR9KWN1_9ACTN|nr:hypothetical protein [Nonomuraea africana]MBE1566435.1 hypothetical protein [Nonomuraea africana]
MEPMVGQGHWSGMALGGVAVAPGMAQAGQLQTQCAMALRQLHGWLQAAVPQAPQLAEFIPLTVQAVRLYRSAQYEACLAQIQQVVNLIGRAGQQNLPPL